MILINGSDVIENHWDVKETEELEEQSNIESYLTFFIDNQYYAYPIKQVREIIEIQEIVPVPEFPDYAKGIINLRGIVIPVIDVRTSLSKPLLEYNERTCIIILDIHDLEVGFIVDTVDEVVDIDEKNISPVPVVSKNSKSRKNIDGVAKANSKIIMLLNAEKMMNAEEIDMLKGSLSQEEIVL